jgi:O-antigen/teichoic acid export membrane protein
VDDRVDHLMSARPEALDVAPAENLSARPKRATSRIAAVLRGGLLGASLGTLALNGAQTLFGSLSTVTLTNVLGPSGFGAYSFAFTWATLLTLPSLLGMTPLVVRYVAAYQEHGAWTRLRGIVRRTNQVVGATSIAVGAIAAAIGTVVLRTGLLTPFLVAMLLVPVISLITMRQAVMAGLGRVVLGRAPDTVAAPGILLALLLGAAAVTGGHYSASAAVTLQVVATVLALCIGVRLLRRALPREVRAVTPAYETREWVQGGLALLLASIAIALQGQVGTLVLGAVKGSTPTGVFAASLRVSTFASFVFAAVNYPLMPTLARLYARGASSEVERVSVRTARMVMVVSVPLLVLAAVFAPTVLGILGGGFRAGATTLRILLIGEIARQITGYGGTVLLMTNRERVYARISIASAALNVGLAVVLVPALGVRGAAIAAVIAVVVQNLTTLFATWRVTGIWTAAVPRPRRHAAGRSRF